MANTFTKAKREGRGRSLLFLALSLAILAVAPASLVVKKSLECNRSAGSLWGPATTMVEMMNEVSIQIATMGVGHVMTP